MYERDRTTVRDRREMLRVKVKSLAEESKIIRREEQRAPGGVLRDELAVHRRGSLRSEARHACLALALLKGRTYEQVERSCHEPPSWARVERMLQRYGRTGWALVVRQDSLTAAYGPLAPG